MATPVYSVRLAAQHAYTGTLDVFAPTGFTMVLRDIDVVYDGSPAAEISILGTAGQFIWFCQSPGGAEIFQWRGRQVFAEGEFFQFQVGSGSWDFTASGYWLALP